MTPTPGKNSPLPFLPPTLLSLSWTLERLFELTRSPFRAHDLASYSAFGTVYRLQRYKDTVRYGILSADVPEDTVNPMYLVKNTQLSSFIQKLGGPLPIHIVDHTRWDLTVGWTTMSSRASSPAGSGRSRSSSPAGSRSRSGSPGGRSRSGSRASSRSSRRSVGSRSRSRSSVGSRSSRSSSPRFVSRFGLILTFAL